MESEPIYQEIKEKFSEFVGYFDEVTHLPDRHVIGALEVKMGNYTANVFYDDFKRFSPQNFLSPRVLNGITFVTCLVKLVYKM